MHVCSLGMLFPSLQNSSDSHWRRSHLPFMFVGMEHIMLSNHVLADEALNAAYAMCEGDPLLINERGVMAYNHGEFERAATLFQEALELAQVTQSSRRSWATTYINLGTCYRRLKWVFFQRLLSSELVPTMHYRRLDEAQETYKQVLELEPRHSVALGFLGMVYHLRNNLDEAIIKYHEVRGLLSLSRILFLISSWC